VVRVAIIFYSATGNTHKLAQAISEGAESAGADLRLRRVPELAPASAIAQNPRWQAFHDAMLSEPTAQLDDLEWADAVAFGTPTRFGLPSAQLKQFLDQTGGLWAKGILADKVCTAFTGASTRHGGLESTILALNNTFYHWGSLIMPVGYADKRASAFGNPYGASWVSQKGSAPDETALEAARFQGERLTRLAQRISVGEV
jgi:NAD(P)H dehydrogenase (quinone)